MTVKKRHKIKVQIQQRARESWWKRHRKNVTSAALVTSLFSCASIYALSQPWESVSDVTVATAESAAQTAPIAAAQPVEVSVAEVAKPSFPANKKLKVSKGDTLISLLTDTGVSVDEAHEAVDAIREIYDPRRINGGQQVALSMDPSEEDPFVPSISSLTMPISGTATVELKRKDDGSFVAKKIEKEIKAHTVYKKLTINNSFYVSAASAGLSPQTISELIKAYSYDVDFQRDVKRGSTLELVLDQMKTEDGKVISSKNLRFVSLNLGKKKIGIYRFTDKNGYTSYYSANGESLKKALLRTPINGARISSGFGMRTHPIMGYSKMHKGVDFAAATGTPIYAAGDGVVSYAGAKGGYGNFVQIKHNDKYATGYGHASRIAPGIKNGVRVKQGQIIAYVGSTGQSTGPHLHYEVYVGGKQVNPSGVKFKTGNALAGKDLKQFKAQVSTVQALMKKGDGATQVASVEPKNTTKKTAKN